MAEVKIIPVKLTKGILYIHSVGSKLIVSIEDIKNLIGEGVDPKVLRNYLEGKLNPEERTMFFINARNHGVPLNDLVALSMALNCTLDEVVWHPTSLSV